MSTHLSGRRRRRDDETSARSRSPYLGEENVNEPASASAQPCGPIGTFDPQSVEEQVTSVQNEQAASSIAATSSSSPGMQTVVPQDDTEASPRSEHCLSLFPVSCVLARTEIKWGGYTYYIRLDRQGSFHTYPDLGGPYQSLQEAEIAIDHHLEERRHPMFRKQDNVSPFDMSIRRGLYWPDGTSRRRSKSRGLETGRDKMRRLILALLDKYNEDHHHSEDLAYELKDVLNFQSILEEYTCYYHLNFITTSKADGDREVFAEVKHSKQGRHFEMFLCCFCMVDSIDKAREAELRRMYKGLEDPGAMERLMKRYSGTPGVLPSD